MRIECCAGARPGDTHATSSQEPGQSSDRVSNKYTWYNDFIQTYKDNLSSNSSKEMMNNLSAKLHSSHEISDIDECVKDFNTLINHVAGDIFKQVKFNDGHAKPVAPDNVLTEH